MFSSTPGQGWGSCPSWWLADRCLGTCSCSKAAGKIKGQSVKSTPVTHTLSYHMDLLGQQFPFMKRSVILPVSHCHPRHRMRKWHGNALANRRCQIWFIVLCYYKQWNSAVKKVRKNMSRGEVAPMVTTEENMVWVELKRLTCMEGGERSSHVMWLCHQSPFCLQVVMVWFSFPLNCERLGLVASDLAKAAEGTWECLLWVWGAAP